jgi:hypothetical protein
MGIVAFLLLMCAPGCLLSFSLPCNGAGMLSRLWLGMALSPAVASLEIVLLKAAGMSFGGSARAVLIANAFAPLLIACLPRRARPQRAEVGWVAVAGAVAAAFAWVLWSSWRSWPSFSHFSWESMLQTELIYAVTRGGVVPETPGMAGHGSGYPFILHYFWAMLSWFLDRPPNAVYKATNLIWLFLSAFLTYEAARMLGSRRPTAVVAVALLFCGNSLLGGAAEGLRILAVPDSLLQPLLETPLFGVWKRYVTDPRFTSYLQKFFAFNVMAITLPLVSALLLAGGGVLRTRDGSWNALFAVVLVALGLLYPLLAPPAFLAAGVIALVAAHSSRPSAPVVHSLLRHGAWIGAAALVVAAVWGPLVVSRGGRAISFASSGAMLLKSVRAAIALGPLLLLSAPLAWNERTRNDPSVLLLAGIAAAGLTMYIVGQLELGNEYKWLFVAATASALLAARTFDLFGLGSRALVLVALALIVTGVSLAHLRFEEMAIRHVMSSPFPEVEGDGFWLRMKAPEEEREWLATLSENTPEDTVLVAEGADLPYYAFARRNEYVALDRGRIGRVGYGMRMASMLTGVHGVPREALVERRRNVNLLYNAPDPRWYPGLLGALRSLDRPLAIRFESGEHPFLRWLRDGAVGAPLLERADGVLWFVPAAGRAER